MTITLPPEIEIELREKAAREGQNVNDVAAALIAAALEWEAQDRAEAIEGIQRGLDDFEQGKYRPFKEFAAEQRIKYNLPSSTSETK